MSYWCRGARVGAGAGPMVWVDESGRHTMEVPALNAHEAQVIINHLLAESWLGEARALDHRTRTGCNANLDAVIALLPLDDQEHPIRCPACGLEATVRRVPLQQLENAALDGS